MLRRALYEAANIMLCRVQRPFALQTWGKRIAEAKSQKRARIAVARKLAVLLHSLWLNETEFRWAWRMLPKCFPPVSTVRRYFYAWRNAGLFETINIVLVMNLREVEGREASPSAGVIDSQSVKTTESGGVWGYDAGKKIRGRKRHILTDTCGFLIFILVHAADIQDRDGAVDVLKAVRFRFPWLRHVFADGGYAGAKLRDALKAHGSWTLEIIKRSDTAQGFELLPRRWVVERTFAWLGRCRRLAKDWERSIASSTAWAHIASIRMLTRRTATYRYA